MRLAFYRAHDYASRVFHKTQGGDVKKAETKRRLGIHLGVRLPYSLHTDVIMYAVRHRLTTSGAVRRLLEIGLKTSQRR